MLNTQEGSHRILQLIGLVLYIILSVSWLIHLLFWLCNIVIRNRQLKKWYKRNYLNEIEHELKRYNYKTLLVRDCFFQSICFVEICILILGIAKNYFSILDYNGYLQNVTTESTNCSKEGSHLLYASERSLFHYVRGIDAVLVLILANQIIILSNFLRNRMLNRSVKNATLKYLLFLIFQAFIVIIFCNKYTYFFNFSPQFFFLLNLFLLVSEGRKLSSVILGRVRELHQSFGNCTKYKIELRKYKQFKILHFNLCISFFICFIGYLLRFVLNQVTLITIILDKNHQCYPLSNYPDIQLRVFSEAAYAYSAVNYLSSILELSGFAMLIIPSYIYMFQCLSVKCKRRNKVYRFGPELTQPLSAQPNS